MKPATLRDRLYRSFGAAPAPPVKCPECRQVIASPKWGRYGWILPSHRGGKKLNSAGFCRGTGQFGVEA